MKNFLLLFVSAFVSVCGLRNVVFNQSIIIKLVALAGMLFSMKSFFAHWLSLREQEKNVKPK
jgi:hypothetical protein